GDFRVHGGGRREQAPGWRACDDQHNISGVKSRTPLAAAVILTLAFVRIPRRAISTDVDSAWCAVLDYARQLGLQFGTDLAFTYGPLGFLTMPCRSPDAAVIQAVSGTVLCLLVTSAICLVAWRLSVLWRVVLLGTFMLLSVNMHAGADFLLDLGLLCWGLLCLVELCSRLRFCIL